MVGYFANAIWISDGGAAELLNEQCHGIEVIGLTVAARPSLDTGVCVGAARSLSLPLLGSAHRHSGPGFGRPALQLVGTRLDHGESPAMARDWRDAEA